MAPRDDKGFGFQRAIGVIARLIFGFAFLPKVTGRQHLPESGGCILACNHHCIVDPVVLAAYTPRPIVFMAKVELFRVPVLSRLIRWYRAFPVDRARGDVSAIRSAMATLNANCVLGIFPEGTRVKDADLGPLEEGTGMIALRSGAPVVPVRIARYAFWRRLRISFGEPVALDDLRGGRIDAARMAEATQRIAEALLRLK